MAWLTTLTLGIALVGLLLASAKAHGRQVRLLRERIGIRTVDFRGDNPQTVKDIWRNDRRVLWATFVASIGAMAAWIIVSWPLPSSWYLAAALPGSLAAAFLVSGLVAWIRLATAPGGEPGWRRRAQWGSVAWWAVVVVVWAATFRLLDRAAT